jgi:glycosyltransferase 2 family protein
MKLGVAALALAGIALTAWLVFHAGVGAILGAVTSVGWAGFALLCVCSLTLTTITGTAWSALVPDLSPVRVLFHIWGRLVRDSAAEVLPFSQFGGLLIGARAVMLLGVAAPAVFASTIVDVTTDLFGQIVFVIIGILLLALRFGSGAGVIPFLAAAGVGLAIAASVALILLLQRGLHLAERLAARWLPRAVKHTEVFARCVEDIYASPVRLAISSAIHLAGWLAGAALTLLAARLIGAKIDFPSAIAIEAMVCALRSAAIVVPAGLGVQEAGYAMLMPLFGVPAEIGIAVSLLKRGREVVTGIPVLLLWQGLEGRRVLAASGSRDV